VLEYKLGGKRLTYKWNNKLDGFNIPVEIVVMEITAAPTQNKQQLKLKSRKAAIGG
jgi:superfamily II DNA or RNA helicase